MFASAAFLMISAIRHRPGRPCQRAPVERENHQRQRDQMPHQLTVSNCITDFKLKDQGHSFYIIEKIALLIPREKHGLQSPSLWKDASWTKSRWDVWKSIVVHHVDDPGTARTCERLSSFNSRMPSSNLKWENHCMYTYKYIIYRYVGMYACIFTCT